MWSQDLSSHLWNERVIVIYADEGHSKQADLQFNKLIAEQEKLVERKLVIYKCVSGQCEFYNGLSSKKLLQLNQSIEGFSAVLIGLDGGKKYKTKAVVEPSAFFSLIDQMPMRRQELRDKDK